MLTLFWFRKLISVCSLALLSMLPATIYAQTVTITGNVTDISTNKPLEGASVELRGTSTGTTTDANGNYSLNLPAREGTLVFSNVGFASQEIPVGNSTTIDIQLSAASSSLNEVVVVGYGTQKRRDITGSVVSVDKQRLEQLPNTNFAQAIQGSVPGVTIEQNVAGAEGNDNSIVIRGRNSITASNTPLIVMDGIPYSGGISDINPTDIASIDVLKDASAAAIYGSRGSNGVILITTKRGSSGKPVISYDGFYGIQQIANLPEMLGPEAFYAFKEQREPGRITNTEQATYDSKQYTDWVGLATQNGVRTQHSLGVRGGGNGVRYYLSGTYLDVQGVAVNDNFKRASTRINVDVNVTDWLSFGTSTQLSYNTRSGLPADFDGNFGAYRFNPLLNAFDDEGKQLIYPWPEDVFFANPLAPTLAQNDDETYKIFTNNYLQVKFPFLEGLSYRLNTGVEYTGRKRATYWGRNTQRGFSSGGELDLNESVNTNLIVENILTYERTFNDHSISVTGLYSYQNDKIIGNTLAAEGFPNDVLTYYQANVALQVVPGASFAKEVLLSQMGRVNYAYKEKYLLTLTGRRDGFSGFGSSTKFGFFPGVALGWNISSENFMSDSRVFDNLKLRVSYGSNGNQAVGPYETLAKLSERSYVNGTATAPGYLPTSLANPGLGWETSNTANIGFDWSAMSGRISGTLDIYSTKTHDLLLKREISPVHGISSIVQNIGKTSNKGVELGLNTVNVKGTDFSWTTNANISFNRNKILDLYGDGKDDVANTWFIGQPILVNFGIVYGGVWQLDDDLTKSAQPDVKPGYAKVVDINEDGVIDDQDRVIQGSRQPSFIWGMGNTFTFKNISLYIFMHGTHGTSRQNQLLSDAVQSGVRYRTAVKNWWTPDNPTNDFYANDLRANVLDARVYEHDSFVRIKDISLAYDFSSKTLSRIGLNRLKVYVNARNLFTFTEWSGLDPELNNQYGIPLQKEYVLGVNVSL